MSILSRNTARPAPRFWRPALIAPLLAVAIGVLGLATPAAWAGPAPHSRPVSPARVASALDACLTNGPWQHADPVSWQSPGNYIVPWSAPFGILNNDSFHVLASGTTRVDFWGANKDVAGDPWIAPNDWPAPGERQYSLIAKVNAGSVLRNGRTYGTNQWFYVGADSGCFTYVGPPDPQLQFGINDPNIGDNGGGPWVWVRQWW